MNPGKRKRDWVTCVSGTSRFSTTVSTLSASSSYFSAKFSSEWAQDTGASCSSIEMRSHLRSSVVREQDCRSPAA